MEKKSFCGILLLTLILTLTLILATSPTMPVAAQAMYPRDETLIIAVHHGEKIDNPDNWNILIPALGIKGSYGSEACLGEYFFYANFETGEFIPWLATDFAYSPDYTKLTVHLRQGVTWSDGYPFTADDVVFTYNDLYLNPKYSAQITIAGPIVELTKTVNKIDDYTVEFVLTKPNPRYHIAYNVFPTTMCHHSAQILPKHIWQGQDPIAFKNYPPISTGPYKLSSVGGTYVIWERDDDWWATRVFGIRPGPKYVIFQSFGTEDEVAFKMAANEVDYAMYATLSYPSFQVVSSKNPEVFIWWDRPPYSYNDPCPCSFTVLCDKYPYNISDVRRAISYMIDRDEVIDIAFDGVTARAWCPFPPYGFLSPYLDAIQDLRTKYEPDVYNMTKANEILTNLGFKKGTDGIWNLPDGTRWTATMPYWLEHLQLNKAALDIADQLIRAGIDVTLKPESTSIWINEVMLGHFDMAVGWCCPGDTDPVSNLGLFHSDKYRPVDVLVPTLEAWFRYKNPQMDALIDQLRATSPVVEKDKCIQLFRQIMEIWYQDCPIMMLCQLPAVMPFNKHYWTGWPSGDNPYIPPLLWMAPFARGICGFQSPTTGQWVGGIKPTTIDYTTIYFTNDTSKFRGIDLVWYGPFKEGDATRVPDDDADFLIARGYASLTPPIVLPPELSELPQVISTLSSTLTQSISSLSSDVSTVSNTVSALAGTLNIILAVQAVTIIFVIVAIVLALRKKS